jgi:hypothetical protein
MKSRPGEKRGFPRGSLQFSVICRVLAPEPVVAPVGEFALLDTEDGDL